MPTGLSLCGVDASTSGVFVGLEVIDHKILGLYVKAKRVGCSTYASRTVSEKKKNRSFDIWSSRLLASILISGCHNEAGSTQKHLRYIEGIINMESLSLLIW